jgi:pimeloyl-ACP methyl ester carboxylesterase
MAVSSLTETARGAAERIGPKVGTAAAVGGVGVAVGSALASMGAATYFARRVVTPEHEKRDDTWVLEVGEDTVTLRAAPHTLSPGRYGLWLDGGAGHARVGEVLAQDLAPRRPSDRTVTRELHGVDYGSLDPGPVRWNAYYYAGDPRSAHGLAFDDVLVSSDVGELPAWRVPPREATGRWAILVHGRSAQREETLRAMPVLHDLGYTSLVPKYRNDLGAPPSSDGRYNLGMSEWRDVEAAIRYAVGHGAREVALVGWSMGGAVVLQTLNRSELSDWVDKVVLDCPVIDWGDVLSHQADLNRLPRSMAVLASFLMGRKWARHLVGVAEPIDIAVANWVERAEELEHPMLLIHSRTDGVVPYGPSQELASRRPDLVTLELWDGPLHCREWNTDAETWERQVRGFLEG